MSVVEHRDVVDTGNARAETRVTSSRLVVSPGQVIAGVLGLVVAMIGVVTLSRAGIDGTLNAPIVTTAGLEQSAIVGIGEVAAGLLLILGALSYSARGLIVGVGVVMVLAGVFIGAASATLLNDIGTVHQTGWVIMVGGIIAIVAGSLGRLIRTRRSVTSV